MKCIVCTQSDVDSYKKFTFHTIDGPSVVFNLMRCPSCSFSYYRHPLIERLYSGNSKYTTNLSGTGSIRELDLLRLRQSYDNFQPFVKLTNDYKLLDIGCNNGDFLRLYSNSNINLAGIDFSINSEFVADLKATSVDIREGTDLNVFGQRFDFITALHVLEHVDNIHGLLNQIKHSLTDNGIAYLEVPDAGRYDEYYNSPFGFYDLEHINHFTSVSLKILLASQGFEILKEFVGDFKMNEELKYPYIAFAIRKNPGKNTNVLLNRIGHINKKHFESYLQRSQSHLTEHAYKGSFNEVVIYGVGANTLRTLGLLDINLNRIKYFVDRNSNYHSKKLCDKQIKSLDHLLNDLTYPDVIIFSKLYFKEIKTNLKELGFKGDVYNFY